jgi:ParB-like chromosome segregation protein Spo0J
MTTGSLITQVGFERQITDGENESILGSLDPLRLIDQLPEITVPVMSLAPAFYLRQAGTDATHVRLLADAAATVKLPSILVQKNSLRIIDGMHRVEAAKLCGLHAISVRIVDCTDQEALVLAVKSNTLHGLPLSRADRISGAKRILGSHPDWSDRAVAMITGLSAKAIASLRNSTVGESPLHLKRLGRDGKRRPVAVGEGRRRAAEYISAHPEASLREVAREADVSLGTVHDVREKLRRGVPASPDRPSRPDDRPSRPGPPAPVQPAGASGLVGLAAPVPTSLPARREIRQLTWTDICTKLTSDPALRYTDGGRAFLRWMAAHSTQADEWREFIDAIPHRWMKDVSQAAIDMSEQWREFALQLRYRQDAAG